MNNMKKIILITSLIATAGIANAQTTLFSSNFDSNTLTGGSAAAITWDTQDTSITAISSLSAISGGAGFANLGATYSNGDNIYLSNNLNTTGAEEGYSFTFTTDTEWELATLNLIAGHTTGTADSDQNYISDLNFSLSGGTLGTAVTGSSTEDYWNSTEAYNSVDFDLTGTTIGAGTYTLSVTMDNLNSGGAFAIYDGVALTTVPEPAYAALLFGLGSFALILRRRK